MTSILAESTSSSQMSPLTPLQEKVSRNKRKFRADPPSGDPTKMIPSSQSKCPGYEFSAEKFEQTPGHAQIIACDLCSVYQNYSDGLKLDLGLSTPVASSEVGPSRPTELLEADKCQDADWSALTESQLEELVLSNLDAIFKSAIKKIVACGYNEEVAAKAVLRSGLCYGCKDIVSNIVDNTSVLLRNGREIDPSREHCFEDLQQLEKYTLAELVCVLQEVRPFLSIGDAMWCLMICDMNVSLACAMDNNPSGGLIGHGAPNGSYVSTQSQWKTKAKNSEINLPNPGKPVSPIDYPQVFCTDAPNIAGAPSVRKPMSSVVFEGKVSGKEGMSSTFDPLYKSFSAHLTYQSHVSQEKFVCSRKVHSGSTEKEYIPRHKSTHLEKNYRTYGCKGSSRTGKLNGLGCLILDKKLKSVTDSALNIKNTSLMISKAMGVDLYQHNRNNYVPTDAGQSPPVAFNLETLSTISALPKPNIPAAVPILRGVRTPPVMSTADSNLSLTLPTKCFSASVPVNCDVEPPSSSLSGVPYDKSLGQWVPPERKDELIQKLVPRVGELQNQLQEWTEWANQKVMQAARRLGKDKAELKTLRREKEEVDRLKREKQTLEENTMKKLSEMEKALFKASGQVERANSAVRMLEGENTALRQEMETAKLHAAKSAANCQEVAKREKKTLTKFQSWDKHKSFLQEELMTEQKKAVQLLRELEQAKVLKAQYEGRRLQEEKAKEELLMQASCIRKEREQVEATAKSKEDMIKSKAENNLQKYKDDIQKLEKEIFQLRMKTDFSKIAALRRGIDGSYAGRLSDLKNEPSHKEPWGPYIADVALDFHDYEMCGVKRERECVMCLSEEMSVVFLPCAHQVVCTTCNELHEKQGMKDCPSCRSPIQQRIHVIYALS